MTNLGVSADYVVNTEDSEARGNVVSPIEPTTSSALMESQNETANKAKQTCKFNPSWQHAFPWVELINKKMFCAICMNSQLQIKRACL